MADPIADYLLEDLETRREAVFLKAALDDVLNGTVRDEHAVLIATAMAFMDACDMAEIDTVAALYQLEDKFTDGVDLGDDPAEGRFVHAAGRA